MSTSSNAGPRTRDQARDRLSDRDMGIIGRAHQLVGVSGPAAVRAYLGATAVSSAHTADARAEALGEASRVIGELLAIIERLADGRAGATVGSEQDEPLVHRQPGSGPRAEVIPASSALAAGDVTLARPGGYEITFTGRAGDVLRAAFDDCTMIIGPGTTTLRAQLPDQAALWGLVQRIIGLGLEVVDMHRMVAE